MKNLLLSLLLFISTLPANEASERVYDIRGILETIDAHVLALRDGDPVKAYGYTSSAYRRETSLAEFIELVKLLPVLRNNRSVCMQSMGEKEGIWIYHGTLTANSGEVYKVEYYLVREKERWRIMGMYLQEAL